VYVPEAQMTYPGLQIVLRTRGDPTIALAAMKREVRSIDPTLAVAHPRSMQDVFDESLARRRFSMTLIGFFAASALALAVAGLYGVIALSVSNRRRELGVRMALGARPGDILHLILREGFGIAAAGVVCGLGGAYAASRLVSSLLYGVSATSLSIYASAAGITVFVTLAATMLPAFRATRVDPTEAFRG
jgi:ABC-type antimicrobial peptide transport system permease subunit